MRSRRATARAASSCGEGSGQIMRELSRREVLATASFAIMGRMVRAQGTAAPRLASVKALVFDTFGTVVDWRSSVIAEGEKLGRDKHLAVDWAKFADAWRAGYGPSMD